MTAHSADPSLPWQQQDLFGLQVQPLPERSTEPLTADLDGQQSAPSVDSPPASIPVPLAFPDHVQASAVPRTSARHSPSLPPIAPVSQSVTGDHASGVPVNLLILDTETSSLSPEDGHCIEVGAILFHVSERAVLSQVSFLLPVADNPAVHVNGIAAAITRLPQPWQAGMACFEAMLASADALLAHNAAFDRQWFGRDPLPLIRKPWICSMEDIRWPPECHLRPNPSVRDLALAYGVPVWAAHRALTDCIYLAQVLERCRDLEELLVSALEPRRLFRACLSYSERQQAKQAGFRWNDPVRGAWSRRLSEREAAALPFPVQPLEAA